MAFNKNKNLPVVFGAIMLTFAYSLTTTVSGFFVVPVTGTAGYKRAEFLLYFTIMTFTSMAVSPFAGKIIKHIRIRRLLMLGSVWCALCFIGFSLCNSLAAFYCVAFFMGLLSAVCANISAVVIITHWFPKNNGRVMGITMAGTGLGAAVMSVILPSFINNFGWRAGYLLVAAIWFVLVFSASFLTGGSHKEKGNTFSGSGAFSKSESSGIEKPPAAEGASFAQAIRSPLLYLCMGGVFIFAIVGNFSQHLPAHLLETEAAFLLSSIMSLFSLCLILFKIFQGFIFDKMGPEKFIFATIPIYAAGFFILLRDTVFSIFLGSIFISYGSACITVMPPLLVSRFFGRKAFPAIWGIASAGNGLGQAVGSPLWGIVYDSASSYRLGIFLMPFFIIAANALLLLALRLSRKAAWKR